MIFATEIVAMTLEICASYLLSPFFGTSNSVWTGIIGVILLSNSIGNYIGGKIAVKHGTKYIRMIFAISALLIFVILKINGYISSLFALMSNNTLGALLDCFVLLLPVEICLGTIPPQVMKNESDVSSDNIGLVYMMSTVGGLVGTFAGGYLMIPITGCNITVFTCGIVILLLAIGKIENSTHVASLIGAIVLSVISLVGLFQNPNSIYDESPTKVYDTQYNRVVVVNGTENGYPVKYMAMAQGFQSATYLDEDKRNDIVFEYLKDFDYIIKQFKGQDVDILMIGGAAYQFPKYFLAHYGENATINVVEIDEQVTQIAKDEFFLQDAIDKFGNERITLTNEDAKTYIARENKQYDIVFNDAFSGRTPIRTLTTLEAIQQIKSILKEDGLYVINAIGTFDHERSEFIKAEMNTLAQEFNYVYLQRCKDLEEDELTNFMIVASDMPLEYDNDYIDYSNGIILTDDYCPVDRLCE